jgi:hypothetical protein
MNAAYKRAWDEQIAKSIMLSEDHVLQRLKVQKPAPAVEQKLQPIKTVGIPQTKRKPGKGNIANSSLPPMINTTPSVKHRFRFLCGSSAFNGNITVTDLFGACGTIGGVNFGYSIASAIRVQNIDVWVGPETAGENAELSWATGVSGFQRDVNKVKSLPGGVTVTGKVSFKPPPKTLAGDFITTAFTASSVLWTMLIPPYSILDMTVEYDLANILANLAITLTTSTPGKPYYLALDGVTSNKLVPVGLPTTT